MSRATRNPKHRWRFPGITQDAAALGVTRYHLYKVLSNGRPGNSLVARYSQLKQAQAATPPTT